MKKEPVIYSLFVRNHSDAGTFSAVTEDLPRIKSLGTDILWLMPIHPTGEANRKGEQGSPYSIRDYRAIEPSFGTREDLEKLVARAHELGMKVIIDVVYNHTSWDSELYKNHPDWFYQKDGKPVSIVEDWSDIIDLDYSHPGLQEELSDTLADWARTVDGFRCDVASRVPLDFWKKAHAACEDIHPGMYWLAESTHVPFLKFCRDQGRPGVCDSQLYEVFDACYDYDAFPLMERYLRGEIGLERWLEKLEDQEALFPGGSVKLRYLENHDTPRINSYLNSDFEWKNWMAFLFMMKGAPLIYEGQEVRQKRRTDFFTKDVIEWKDDPEDEKYIASLAKIHSLMEGPVTYDAVNDGTAMIKRDGMIGLFALKEGPEWIPVDLDGTYENLINGKTVEIHGSICRDELPFIAKADVKGIRSI